MIDKQYIIGYSLLKDGTMPNSFKSTNNSFIKDVIIRNKIIDSILNITKDPRNNLNLTTPVSTKTLQDISATSPLGELSKIMNPSNPASIYQMQIENGVGKSTIGVAATGVKAFYNLTYYYNNGWLDVKKLCELGEYDKAYSLALELSISNIKNDNKDRTLVDANLLIFDDEFMELLSVNSKVLYDLIDTIKNTNYQMSDASLAAGELLNSSTDNAKELILKKINADGSFMDIYIAGLALGLSLNSIAKIMMDSDVNSLIRESGANIFTEQIRTSYKRKLKGSLGLIKNYRGDKIKVTENIILFNKLLDVSEEFNMLGKMTSINQGIPTDKFDLYNLIYSVNKYFNGTEDEPTGMNFDLMRFFTDDDYAKDQIAIYETQKRSFNILRSLYNNPLMNSLYKILCTAIQTSNALSRRNHLEYELFGIQDISSREKYADLRDTISKTFDIDFVSSKDISFVVPAGVSIITQQGPVVLSESKRFNIESVFDLVGSNIATFKSYMEQYYIPKLKELYPDNRFIQDLTFGVHVFDGKDSIYYKLPLNMMEVGSNTQSTELYEEYSKGFFDLIGQTLDDNNILDMFYIYNLFANKTFSQSSLTRLFSDLVALNKAESLVVSHNHWFDNQDMDYLLSTFTNESLEPTVYNTPVKSSNNKAYSLNIPKEILLDSIFDNPEIWGANISHVHKLTKETINEVLNSYGLSDDYISSHNLDTAKAFVYNGEIFINTDLGNNTDLVHELSHWLIALMKQNKNGYFRLREVYDRIKSTKMYNKLKDYPIYTDLNNDDFYEEVLAHLIADDIKWIKELGIKLPKNDTVAFVKEMLDPNSEIGINTEQFIKIRSSQKITELRNQLIEDDKIIEDCK